MKNALNQFHQNIAQVQSLCNLYKALNSLTTVAMDLSDILRATLVMLVSALDQYIHELVRLGMLEIQLGSRLSTPAFRSFKISMEAFQLAIAQPGTQSWFEDEIRNNHGWRSFQQADKIAEAIRLIFDKQLWDEVAHHLLRTPKDIKEQLNLIVERRNKIAHEADLDPTTFGQRWPINAPVVDDAIDFVQQIAESIFLVVT
jgi:hypothetical protein